MKALIRVLAIVAIAFVCMGYVKDAQNQPELTPKPFVEVVHSGDTVDGILKEYYNEANEGVSFGEFKYNTLHLPENKHLLNQHGGLKLLQVGEKIHIVAKVRATK